MSVLEWFLRKTDRWYDFTRRWLPWYWWARPRLALWLGSRGHQYLAGRLLIVRKPTSVVTRPAGLVSVIVMRLMPVSVFRIVPSSPWSMYSSLVERFQPVVPGTTTAPGTRLDHERLEEAPLLIAHQSTNQGRSPQRAGPRGHWHHVTPLVRAGRHRR